MGENYLVEFNSCGGTIGRGLDNDWALPDAKRYLSTRHALIDFQGGAYYLVDLSRNGIYINNADAPVGQGHPQRLFDGDRLRMGEFDIYVAVIESPDDQSDDGMRDSVVRAQQVPEDLSEEHSLLPLNEMNDEGALEKHLVPGDGSAEVSALQESPFRTEETSLSEGAAQLLQAAGIDSKEVAGMPPEDLMRTAGLLLREYTAATLGLLATQKELLGTLDIKEQAGQSTDNPLNKGANTHDALFSLLSDNLESTASGCDHVRNTFEDVRQQQRALLQAMSGALEDFLVGFDPETLKKKIG
ncbi:MAG: type VI secretion system-associated FHA domain protein, partial [Gammaproteobacteria bacterium]